MTAPDFEIDPDCPGTGQHGSISAYRQRGCRCPEAVEANQVKYRRFYGQRHRHNARRAA